MINFLRRSNWGLILIVMVITIITHASYINNGFTWLDHGDIEYGRTILPAFDFLQAWITRLGETQFYRPIVTILNSTDFLIYHTAAWGFHLTNVLLHALAVLGVMFFVTAYFQCSKKEAALVGLIFGVHPLSWLPVGAISYRQEILAVIFTMLAIGCYIRAVTRKDRRWWIGAFLGWALAIFSKEAALIWGPGLILVWEFTQPQRSKRYWREWLGLLGVVLVYALLRKIAIPESWSFAGGLSNMATTLGTGIELLGRRIIELAVPFLPGLSDVTVVKSIFDIRIVLILFLIVIPTGWGLFQKDQNWRRFIGFVLVSLLPAIGIFYLPRLSSPHYGYLASVGFGVLMVQLLRKIKTEEHKYILQNLVGAWIILATINVFIGGFRFQDDIKLFTPEVARDSRYREGAYYLGNAHWQRGDLDRAAEYFKKSLETPEGVITFVDRPAAMVNLAGVELNRGNRSVAITLLQQIVNEFEGGSNRQLALYNLALIEFQDNHYEDSLKWLNMMEHTDRAEIQQLRLAVESAMQLAPK